MTLSQGGGGEIRELGTAGKEAKDFKKKGKGWNQSGWIIQGRASGQTNPWAGELESKRWGISAISCNKQELRDLGRTWQPSPL